MKREEQIDAVMNSLDGIEPAEPSPYLYSKIRARMKNNNEAQVLPGQWGWRLALVMAIIGILNILTVQHLRTSESTSDNTATNEYHFTVTDSY